VKRSIHMAVVLGVTALMAEASAQHLLVRTTARAVSRQETRQTLHVVDVARGEILPWRATLPGMECASRLTLCPDSRYAFLATRRLWPHPEGWPTRLTAVNAISLNPLELLEAGGAGVLLEPDQEFGCAMPQLGASSIPVLMFEPRETLPDAGRVTLREFDPSAGFESAPRASWQMPGVPVQALPLASGRRAAVLCHGPLGALVAVIDLRAHGVVAEATLPLPEEELLYGAESPLEMALSADGSRLLVLTSGFSLESPEGAPRSWLHQLDAASLQPVDEPRELPGIPQSPGRSLWPLGNGACWLATRHPGEGFAFLHRLPLAASAPRAVEQPFTNVPEALLAAPAPKGDGLAVGVRNRLEIWPAGEPAGMPLQFDDELTFVTWLESGLFVGEGQRLHQVNPDTGAVIATMAFTTGIPAELLPLESGAISPQLPPPDGGASAIWPAVVAFRGEAVGHERRVIRMRAEGEPEVPWRLEYDAAAMPWLHVHPRSGGPGQAEFAVMGIDASVSTAQPPDTSLRGFIRVVLGDEAAFADGSGVREHAMVVLVSPRPSGPRRILWLLGHSEGAEELLVPGGGHPLQAATALLAGPPHWFSHQAASSPLSEPLTEHSLVVLTARAASEGIVTRQALLSCVAAGGGVLFLGSHLEESEGRALTDWLAPVGVRLDTTKAVSGEFEVSGAPLLCRNWERVAIQQGCRMEVNPPGTTLVRDPTRGSAIFAVAPYGLGRFAFLAAATPLENVALSGTAQRRFVGDLIRWLDSAAREVSDVDGDGIPDAIEDANQNGALDPGETDRFNPDTDGDGIPDGIEDRNRNGRVDEGETSAINPDSDGDGIPDGADRSPLPPAGATVIDAVRPAAWPAEGGIWVQLSGRNFAPGARVRFGGIPAEQLRVLGSQGLEALLPAWPQSEGGAVDVAVERLEPGQSSTIPGGFRYLPRSTVTLELGQTDIPGTGEFQLALTASAGRMAQVDRLTFRVNTEPPRALEWLDALPGADALRSGRQVTSRPDPEGGLWLDISPARAGYPLGVLVRIHGRPATQTADTTPEFTLTRARAFTPGGVPLEVITGE
jgi:hypothetical protein